LKRKASGYFGDDGEKGPWEIDNVKRMMTASEAPTAGKAGPAIAATATLTDSPAELRDEPELEVRHRSAEGELLFCIGKYPENLKALKEIVQCEFNLHEQKLKITYLHHSTEQLLIDDLDYKDARENQISPFYIETRLLA
jgi:hypothetical protein